jgi:hypothetical protein
MTPGELAAFDQLLEVAMTTTLKHVALRHWAEWPP